MLGQQRHVARGARAGAARGFRRPAGGRTDRGGNGLPEWPVPAAGWWPPPRGTSTRMGVLPPTRSNGWPSRMRRNLAWVPGVHLADLVEEDRAVVGGLELADLLFRGAGEGALLVAEQLAFQQRLGQGGAVEADERPIAGGGWNSGWPGPPIPCPRRSRRGSGPWRWCRPPGRSGLDVGGWPGCRRSTRFRRAAGRAASGSRQSARPAVASGGVRRPQIAWRRPRRIPDPPHPAPCADRCNTDE